MKNILELGRIWWRYVFLSWWRKSHRERWQTRFKKLDDLDLDAIGRVIVETRMEQFIGRFDATRKRT